ncbi:LytTR family transcriptional regulator [Marinilongibacter aquaticus]|uniref:LytTR family DNA-binding domain-containing protein n=1 Tax=Marinilongibacter aquaticus TaxID=2975157 RepID=UPI0035B65C74|nr:LytTR family transcriptional regulator [Marinilongibacter aquaticus]
MKRIQYPSEEEIIFLRGVVNYTEFHLKNGKKYVSSFTLKRHEEQHSDFLRVSKSHLLNPNFIKTVKTEGSERTVILKNGSRIKVSRRRRGILEQIQIALN